MSGILTNQRAAFLPGNETIGHIGHPGTTISLDGGTQDTQLSHLTHDVAVECLVSVGHGHTGQQLLLTNSKQE